MLVLTRKRDEWISIGENVIVRVLAIHGDQVQLGIDAPREIPVHRGEIREQILKGDWDIHIYLAQKPGRVRNFHVVAILLRGRSGGRKVDSRLCRSGLQRGWRSALNGVWRLSRVARLRVDARRACGRLAVVEPVGKLPAAPGALFNEI